MHEDVKPAFLRFFVAGCHLRVFINSLFPLPMKYNSNRLFRAYPASSILTVALFLLFSINGAWSDTTLYPLRESSAILDDLPEKHPLDKAEYRRFQLENGIKVILLFDPKLNKASASMCVGVGSLTDPKSRQGLAHFFEHMLFLGTEKYPGVNDYSSYLQTNGGYSNAYTAEDHTNYHFEVYNEAFEGALDRFAQFFIAPLFTKEFSEREMNAVNSEHQKNLENDKWRGYQLRRMHCNPGHPANHFSTGNADTLEGVRREEFLDFYKKYYSANVMTLALASTVSLDVMENWIKEYFTEIPNHNKPVLTYPTNILEPKKALRFIKMVPVKDNRSLQIDFPIPPLSRFYESKPGELLSFIIGYEGEGSLLSYLKKENLATSLGAGSYDPTPDYGILSISVELTEKGFAQYRDVLQYVFSYIDVMKKAEYPENIYYERAAMAKLDEVYSDKGEGADRSVFLANQLRLYPLDIAEREPYLYVKPDAEAYQQFMDALRPDNMLVKLMGQGLETDQVEPYYGTHYSYTEEGGDYFNSLYNPPSVEELFIPKSNPFIPKTVVQLEERPVKIVDESGLILYYLQDTEFQRPKATLILTIRQSKKKASIKAQVMKDFYSSCVMEALNEIAYPAAMAGLNYAFTADLEGVSLTITGYNESAFILLDRILDKMKDFGLDEERFLNIKDNLVRKLENFKKEDAWRIARQKKNEILYEVIFNPLEQLEVAKKVQLDDVRKFGETLYNLGKIEALVHGNITANEAKEALYRIKKKLRIKPLKENKVFQTRLIDLDPGESLFDIHEGEVNNSCFWREYALGVDSPDVRATGLILDNAINEPFFTEMRTNQQLGYIVFGGLARVKKLYIGYFIIQSGEYAADDLNQRADTFLTGFAESFRSLPPEAFEQLKSAAKAKVEEKPKSISEKANQLFARAFDHDEDWSRNTDTLRAIDNITFEEVALALETMLRPEVRKMRTTLLFSRDHQKTLPIEDSIEDLEAWKKTKSFK